MGRLLVGVGFRRSRNSEERLQVASLLQLGDIGRYQTLAHLEMCVDQPVLVVLGEVSDLPPVQRLALLVFSVAHIGNDSLAAFPSFQVVARDVVELSLIRGSKVCLVRIAADLVLTCNVITQFTGVLR